MQAPLWECKAFLTTFRLLQCASSIPVPAAGTSHISPSSQRFVIPVRRAQSLGCSLFTPLLKEEAPHVPQLWAACGMQLELSAGTEPSRSSPATMAANTAM